MNSIKSLSKPHLYKSERSYQTTPRNNKVNKEMVDLNLNDIDSNINNERILKKTRSNVSIRNNDYYDQGRNNENEQLKRIDIRYNDYPQTPHQEAMPYRLSNNTTTCHKKLCYNGSKKFMSREQQHVDNNNSKTIPHNLQKTNIINHDLSIGINDSDVNDYDHHSNSNSNNKHIDNKNSYRNYFNYTVSRPLSHIVYERNAVKKENLNKAQIPVNNNSSINNNNNNKDIDKSPLCMKIVQELIDIYSSKTHNAIQPEELVKRIENDFFNNQSKDEFINSVYSLYLTTMPPNKKKKTDISDLWEWIQSNHKNSEIAVREGRNDNENDVYKQYCEGIMEEYDLKNFEEMKEFLDELLLKNNKNEKFVEGMKKILCKDLGRRKKNGNLSSSNATYNNNTYAG